MLTGANSLQRLFEKHDRDPQNTRKSNIERQHSPKRTYIFTVTLKLQ